MTFKEKREKLITGFNELNKTLEVFAKQMDEVNNMRAELLEPHGDGMWIQRNLPLVFQKIFDIAEGLEAATKEMGTLMTTLPETIADYKKYNKEIQLISVDEWKSKINTLADELKKKVNEYDNKDD